MSRKRSHEDVSEEAEDVFVYYEHTELSSIPKGISSLRIDGSVRKFLLIGEEAFAYCTQLQVETLPHSLKIIKKEAFHVCQKLQNIEVHDGIRLEEGVFSSCDGLTRCRLPGGMVKIPAGLFFDCRSLKHVDVPSLVLEIGDSAFRLAGPCQLEVPTGLNSILRYAFYQSEITQLDLSGCTNLSSIGQFAFDRCKHLKDVILPRTGLKRIEVGTFQRCESLTHLWIPPTVEYVDREAFAGCTSLLSIEVPETLERIVFVFEHYYVEHNEDHWYEMCRYESLVNIYIPPTHQLEEVHQYRFMEELKLSEAEGNYEALVGKLKVRFDSLPLHRASYFQSYQSLPENVEIFKSILRNDGPHACERVDFLGMTPFHILALSHRPQLALFQELLSESSVDITKSHDVFGATPLDYLCKNEAEAAVRVTKLLLVSIMEARISLLGLPLWRKDVMSGLEEVQRAQSGDLGTKVASLCRKLEKYERMESLSLLEMSIWRLKVESERATGSEARDSCRISCGSGIVLEHVRPYLEGEQAIDNIDGDSDGDGSGDSSDELDDDDDHSGDEMDDGDY